MLSVTAPGPTADATLVSSEMLEFIGCCVLPLYVLGLRVNPIGLTPVRSARVKPAVATRLPRRLFAASFALSLSLLVLILLDVVDGLNGASRRALWRVALLAHLALLVVVLPLAQIRLTALLELLSEPPPPPTHTLYYYHYYYYYYYYITSFYCHTTIMVTLYYFTQPGSTRDDLC